MPRYQRAADILGLALDLQASAEGLTLDDICERFQVDRRTATRMRDAVAAIFPGAEGRLCYEGKKPWRFPNGPARALVHFDALELAAQEAVKKLSDRSSWRPPMGM